MPISPERNSRMVKYMSPGDHLLAFPAEDSRGTWDCFRKGEEKKGLCVEVTGGGWLETLAKMQQRWDGLDAHYRHAGNARGNATPHRGAHDHYGTTRTDDLATIPVAGSVAKDAALFMWVVDSHLEESIVRDPKLGTAEQRPGRTHAGRPEHEVVLIRQRVGGKRESPPDNTNRRFLLVPRSV